MLPRICVSVFVINVVAFRVESPPAYLALERSQSRVYSDMYIQIASLCENFFADLALDFSRTVMGSEEMLSSALLI